MGAPAPHRKRWGAFKASSARLLAVVESLVANADAATLVATVPPQHMFGLETSVLLPWFSRIAVHAGRPLLPADVARALAEVPEPRILVSTPLHLETLVASGVRLPKSRWCCARPRRCSPSGHMRSSRSSTRGSARSSARPRPARSRTAARHGTTSGAVPGVALVPLPEAPACRPTGCPPGPCCRRGGTAAESRFALRGRNGDMVEIAGKRASLAGLNRRLLSVPGVRDAFLFQPDAGGAVRRVAGARGRAGARRRGNPGVPAPQRGPGVPAAAAAAGRRAAAQRGRQAARASACWRCSGNRS
jgi:hypothetical protein